MNCHGRFECVPVQDMDLMAQMLVKLVSIEVEKIFPAVFRSSAESFGKRRRAQRKRRNPRAMLRIATHVFT